MVHCKYDDLAGRYRVETLCRDMLFMEEIVPTTYKMIMNIMKKVEPKFEHRQRKTIEMLADLEKRESRCTEHILHDRRSEHEVSSSIDLSTTRNTDVSLLLPTVVHSSSPRSSICVDDRMHCKIRCIEFVIMTWLRRILTNAFDSRKISWQSKSVFLATIKRSCPLNRNRNRTSVRSPRPETVRLYGSCSAPLT